MTHPMLIWLESCLDTEERVALAAQEKALSPWRNSNGLVKHSGPPESGHGRDDGLWDDEGTSGMKVDHQLCMLGEVAEHVALHDPAAVLADIAAKREIIELHTGEHECRGDRHGHLDTVLVAPGYIHENCPTIVLLASAYKHHPGWQSGWGPT